jgi:hypothetical protein
MGNTGLWVFRASRSDSGVTARSRPSQSSGSNSTPISFVANSDGMNALASSLDFRLSAWNSI